MQQSTKLFDLSNWSVIDVTGPDRKSFLHSFCTNEINKLSERQVCEAFVPDVKGRILGHVLVINLPDRLSLLSVPGTNECIAPHLTKYLLGVEAEVHDRSPDEGVALIVGDFTAPGLPTEQPQANAQVSDFEIDGNSLHLFQHDITPHPTYWITGSIEGIATLVSSMSGSEIAIGTDEEFQSLRIAGGFPFAGKDISEANIAQEAARTEQAISFTKGCYLGQEPIARLDAMGHTNKELRGFYIAGTNLSPGAKLVVDGNEVGQLTTVAAWEDKSTVGLGIIRIKFAQPGSKVNVVTDNGTYAAKVFWPKLS